MLRAAQEAEIDQAQLTRQFQLVEGSHKRLAMQPRAFWQWYAVTLTAEFGLPIETKRAARLRAATLGAARRWPRCRCRSQTTRVQLPLGQKAQA
jgi:hypothetical protein